MGEPRRNLGDILSEVLQGQQGDIYGSRWTCQAMLRSLPPLAKQYVMRLLLVEGEVRADQLQSWAQPQAETDHRRALSRLKELRILHDRRAPAPTGGTRLVFSLNAQFRRHLLTAVQSGGVDGRSEVPPESVLRAVPALIGIQEYARRQWESLMLFVSSPESRTDPPEFPWGLRTAPMDLPAVLEGAGLWEAEGRGRGKLTSKGFKFLLDDTYGQLWGLLKQYIKMACGETGELAAIISFLLQLGFRQVGQPCPYGVLTPVEAEVAGHMAQLGVIYMIEENGGRGVPQWYCPTSLAASLCAGAGTTTQLQHGLDGFVIVETNYRVYGYTTSPVRAALLRFFTQCECVLPNLYVGTLTRESVRRAFDSGIEAKQIIEFLTKHAHPQSLRKPSGPIPDAVSDQIRLWETENNRMTSAPAFMLDQFKHPDLYKRTAAMARELGLMLWENPAKELLVVRAEPTELADQLTQFIKAEKLVLGL